MGKRKGKPDTASEPVVEPEETTSAPEPEPEEHGAEEEPEEATPETAPEEPVAEPEEATPETEVPEKKESKKRRPAEWLRELGLLPAVISGVLMYHQHAPFCWRGTNTLVTQKEAEAGFERWKTRITGELLRVRLEREKKKKGGN